MIDLTDEAFHESFLSSPMFTERSGYDSRSRQPKPDLRKKLNTNRFKTKLELTSVQIKRLNDTADLDVDTVLDVLDEHQFKKLNASLVQNETKRLGTVAALSAGHVARLLKLTESEADALHEAGKQIYSEMHQRLHEQNQQDVKNGIASFPAEIAKQLSSVLMMANRKSGTFEN